MKKINNFFREWSPLITFLLSIIGVMLGVWSQYSYKALDQRITSVNNLIRLNEDNSGTLITGSVFEGNGVGIGVTSNLPKAQPDNQVLKNKCFYWTTFSVSSGAWRWRSESINEYFPTREDAVLNCLAMLGGGSN